MNGNVGKVNDSVLLKRDLNASQGKCNDVNTNNKKGRHEKRIKATTKRKAAQSRSKKCNSLDTDQRDTRRTIADKLNLVRTIFNFEKPKTYYSVCPNCLDGEKECTYLLCSDCYNLDKSRFCVTCEKTLIIADNDVAAIHFHDMTLTQIFSKENLYDKDEVAHLPTRCGKCEKRICHDYTEND